MDLNGDGRPPRVSAGLDHMIDQRPPGLDHALARHVSATYIPHHSAGAAIYPPTGSVPTHPPPLPPPPAHRLGSYRSASTGWHPTTDPGPAYVTDPYSGHQESAQFDMSRGAGLVHQQVPPPPHIQRDYHQQQAYYQHQLNLAAAVEPPMRLGPFSVPPTSPPPSNGVEAQHQQQLGMESISGNLAAAVARMRVGSDVALAARTAPPPLPHLYRLDSPPPRVHPPPAPPSLGVSGLGGVSGGGSSFFNSLFGGWFGGPAELSDLTLCGLSVPTPPSMSPAPPPDPAVTSKLPDPAMVSTPPSAAPSPVLETPLESAAQPALVSTAAVVRAAMIETVVVGQLVSPATPPAPPTPPVALPVPEQSKLALPSPPAPAVPPPPPPTASPPAAPVGTPTAAASLQLRPSYSAVLLKPPPSTLQLDGAATRCSSAVPSATAAGDSAGSGGRRSGGGRRQGRRRKAASSSVAAAVSSEKTGCPTPQPAAAGSKPPTPVRSRSSHQSLESPSVVSKPALGTSQSDAVEIPAVADSYTPSKRSSKRKPTKITVRTADPSGTASGGGGGSNRSAAVRADSVASADCAVETLNNNRGRTQPSQPRRPLNYNNNLGTASCEQSAVISAGGGGGVLAGDGGTGVTPASVADATAKKRDVNVGKQKNYCNTSNQNKQIGDALSKPDNKTLSQSRCSAHSDAPSTAAFNDVNSTSSSTAHSTAGSSKASGKDLLASFRNGGVIRRSSTAAARRREDSAAAADSPLTAGGEAAGGGHQLVRLMRLHLLPSLLLVAALVTWLLHLVADVMLMSSRLMAALFISLAAYMAEQVNRCRCYVCSSVESSVDSVCGWFRRRWRRRSSSASAASSLSAGLGSNITLPTTGEEAMKRLLACRGMDPYSILGVTHDCSDSELKRFYRRQALLVHPDKSRSPGADEAFKILQRAFEMVGFAERRAAFDASVQKNEADSAFQQYTDDLMNKLREKIEETQNTLRCNNCNRRHRRCKTARPCYAARVCNSCKIRHAAREGDIWAESCWLGVFWRYYACMEGAVYDITEWACCQSASLKHLQANSHSVQYRIVSGAKKHSKQQQQQQHHTHNKEQTRDGELDDILNSFYSGTMGGDDSHQGHQRRAKGGRRKGH